MFCPKCGTQNADIAAFCKGCGNPLTRRPDPMEPAAGAGQTQGTVGQIPPANDTISQNLVQNATQNPMQSPVQGAAPTGAQTGNAAGGFSGWDNGGAATGGWDQANGAPQGPNNGMPVWTPNDTQGQKKQQPQIPVQLIIGIAAAVFAVFVLIIGIFIFANRRVTINLDKYVKVEAEGYNGYGNAYVAVDWEAIEAKYGKKLKMTRIGKKQINALSLLYGTTPLSVVQTCVGIQTSDPDFPYGKVSNGMKIPYTWNVDDDVTKFVKCKLKYSDGEIEVGGLEEVTTFDAFAGVTLDFEGIAPNGEANLNYNGSDLDYYDFYCDKTYGLSNGDTVKVTIDESRVDYYAQNLGKVPETLEKDFTVSGLQSYVLHLNEVSDAAMTAMQKEATDAFQAYVAQRWSAETEHLQSFEYIGDYLLTPKSEDNWDDRNFLYLVYKVRVRNTYSNDYSRYDKENVVYWVIEFNNLITDTDGSVQVDATDYRVIDNYYQIDSGVDGYYWFYNAFPTVDELYQKVVMQYVDEYNHEDNVN